MTTESVNELVRWVKAILVLAVIAAAIILFFIYILPVIKGIWPEAGPELGGYSIGDKVPDEWLSSNFPEGAVTPRGVQPLTKERDGDFVFQNGYGDVIIVDKDTRSIKKYIPLNSKRKKFIPYMPKYTLKKSNNILRIYGDNKYTLIYLYENKNTGEKEIKFDLFKEDIVIGSVKDNVFSILSDSVIKERLDPGSKNDVRIPFDIYALKNAKISEDGKKIEF